jgi:hypothetical protein
MNYLESLTKDQKALLFNDLMFLMNRIDGDKIADVEWPRLINLAQRVAELNPNPPKPILRVLS